MSNDQNALEVILNCIRYEVKGDPLFLEEFSIKEVLSISKKHELIHLVAAALLESQVDISDELKLKLSKKQDLYNAVDMWQEGNLYLIGELFEEAQIRYLPLKGSIVKTYYPESWMRYSADIDILIHKEDMEKASDLLVEEGFLKIREGSHCWEYIAPDGRTHFELHYRLINKVVLPKVSAILDNVWNYASLEEGSSYHYVLTNELFYLYHLAHMAIHILKGGCGIRPFVDVWVLNEKLHFDEKIMNDLLIQSDLLEFEKSSKELAYNWMNGKYELTHGPMEEFIVYGGLFGESESGFALTQARVGGKYVNVLQRIFLPVKEMKYRYPILKKCILLLPFCYLYYWIWVIRSGKLSSGKRIIQKNMNISQEQKQKANVVLKGFGLE